MDKFFFLYMTIVTALSLIAVNGVLPLPNEVAVVILIAIHFATIYPS